MFRLKVFNSIKFKAVLTLMAAGAVPMIVSMALINSRSQETLIAKTEAAFIDSVTVRENLLNDHIDAFKNYGQIIASVPPVQSFMGFASNGLEVPDDVLKEAGTELAIYQDQLWGETHHILLVDQEGTVVLNAPSEGWDNEHITAQDMRDFQGPHYLSSIAEIEGLEMAREQAIVTDCFQFDDREHYHPLVINPIFDLAGQTIGFVVIEISVDYMNMLLQSQYSMDLSEDFYLTTKDGLRMVHGALELGETTLRQADILAQVNANGGEIVSGWFTSAKGREVFGVYHASEEYPWIVCVEVDRLHIEAPIRAQHRLFLIVSAMSLLVFGVAVFLVGKMFWGSLRLVAQAADRVADGDLWHEIVVTRSDELGQLEGAVEAMRMSMKQQIDHLDALVAERTAELEYANEKLEHDAEHDGLTGLSNRQAFCARLKVELAKYQKDKRHLISVMFFDFDRFKVVNDSLGHAAGDALLCSISERFRSELRDTDLPARFGGDEFVVMLSPVETHEHACQAAQRLLEIFEAAHDINGHRIVSTASIGLVIADPRYVNAEDMIRDADAAMYEAKLAGKNQVVIFDEQMYEDARRRLHLEEDLSCAIEKRQLRVMYQPIIGAEDMDITGFEALIRWEHPEMGMVNPDQFIPIAEDTGQIVEVGGWILRESVEQIVRWENEFDMKGKLSINVNVSKRQLIHPEFLDLVKDVLHSTGIEPCQLKIEITESTVIDPRHDMRSVIDRVRDLGVLLAMDDFGTGHSSLSLLHEFNFDILKIDQSFVRGMESSREMSAVLHSIIALAQNTGMRVVAEGAETRSQVACLISHECDMIQGYYFARPMFAKEAGEFLCGPRDYSQAA